MASDSIRMPDVHGFNFIDEPISGAAKEALCPLWADLCISSVQDQIILHNLVKFLFETVDSLYVMEKHGPAKILEVVAGKCAMSPDTVRYLLNVVVKARLRYHYTQEQGRVTHEDYTAALPEPDEKRIMSLCDVLHGHPMGKDLYGTTPFDLVINGAKKRKATDDASGHATVKRRLEKVEDVVGNMAALAASTEQKVQGVLREIAASKKALRKSVKKLRSINDKVEITDYELNGVMEQVDDADKRLGNIEARLAVVEDIRERVLGMEEDDLENLRDRTFNLEEKLEQITEDLEVGKEH